MSLWKTICCFGDLPAPTRKTTKKKRKCSQNNFCAQLKLSSPNKFSVSHKESLNDTPYFKEQMKFLEGDSFTAEKQDLYEGEELNGVPHGTGTMSYSNGDFYRGEWVNGLKEGRGLQSYFVLKSKYEGEWKKGECNGQGKYTQENESYYMGYFKDGKRHGKGQYYDNETSCTYEQNYKEGKLKQRVQVVRKKQKAIEFPSLVLDKERFNSLDLQKFQQENPQIQELDLDFLLKYYGLCKIISLPFIKNPITEWSITEVLDFLDGIDLNSYRKVFYENKIKGKDLVSLQEEELKGDLMMKLGDRKKLMNYIEYLVSLDKLKKAPKKKKKMKRRGSFTVSQRDKLQQTLLSVESRISEAENQDETWKEESEKSSINKSKLKKNLHKGFDTEDWDQYNLNLAHQIQFHSQITIESKEESQKSNQQIRASDEQLEEYFAAPAYGKRKKSQDRHDNLTNSLVQNQNNNINNKTNFLDKKDKQQTESSSSNNSSISSFDEERFKLKRKKTISSGQEIRELYEFLKENKSLDFIIKKKDIEITEQIGEGSYGKVYRGKYMSCPVAVKDYMKAGCSQKNREDFMKAVYILSELKHPNLVLYMGMCITVNEYQLVTQFLQNGSLFDQIHKKKTKFESAQIFQIIDDIVRGMVYLHSMKRMIHKDLKSSNVLIDEDWKVKVCDFGLSSHKRKKKKKVTKNKMGNIQWMAPEVIRNEEIDYYSDVYSFGVIIWELLTEKIPYEGLTEVQITGLVGYDDNHTLPPPHEDSDPFIMGLMQKCLHRNPAHRPTFIQIQKDLDEERSQRSNMKVDWSNK